MKYVCTMQTLLVPLDTSASAAKVLAHAESLAIKLGAKIELFHVVEPVATYVPAGVAMDVVTAAQPSLEPEQAEGAIKRLETLAAPLRAKGIETSCDAAIGLAVDEILEKAKSSDAGYVILGSHGHGALYHLFSGSVVTGVLKHSPCPVVVVPARE